MKCYCFLILAAVLACPFGGTGIAQDDPPSANLVANPSFEMADENSPIPVDWNGDRQVFSRSVGAGRDGSAALKCCNDDPDRYRLAKQALPLQAGRKYRISGWVRTDGVTGDESGATFCIEWSDQAGKWMGGIYPSGVKGTQEWTRIEGVFRLPQDAGTCGLSCYLRREMTGNAWFDDLEVIRIADPPLHSVLTSPIYRGRITATGPKTIRVKIRIDLRDYELSPSDLCIRGELCDLADNRVLQETERSLAELDTAEPLVLETSVGKLPPGEYYWNSSLIDGDGKTVYATRHPLERVPDNFAPTARIDRHRRLLVDGEPFFPLGMYWSSITEDDLKIYSQSKFNCVMPYGTPNRQQMDLAEQYGVRVIYSIKNWYAGSRWCPANIKSPADEEPLVRSRVREFRDHPALLAWYLNDELPQSFLPQLEAHQRWVTEEDPNHPTWAVLYQVNEVSAYLNTFDVIGTDPYPIGRKPASLAAQWTAETLRQVASARPMWQVPQLHNWANYAKTDTEREQGRTPTYDEVRSMAWQCIAEGATGLVFYSWYDMKRNPDVSFDVQWAGLQRVAAEIDRMAPIVLSVEPTPDVRVDTAESPAWLHWLVRRHEGKLYLIAVNDGDGEGTVGFRLPVTIQSVQEVTEDRKLKPHGQGFEDHFDRYSVRIYEIR